MNTFFNPDDNDKFDRWASKQDFTPVITTTPLPDDDVKEEPKKKIRTISRCKNCKTIVKNGYLRCYNCNKRFQLL